MPLLEKLPLDRLTPSRLWAEMDLDSRTLAARSLFDRAWEDAATRAEANNAIAAALRFREQRVRQLPVEQRVRYLVRAVQPDDSLATSLLMALHLVQRKTLLETFLDELGIPQKDGVIDSDQEVDTGDPERLEAAVRTLRERFAEGEVELYLASLLAMDPDTWGAIGKLVGGQAD